MAARTVGLVKRFEDVTAVAGVDLEVARGECFGLLGPNGAGKTTTVEILEGLQRPTAGTVELFGLDWHAGSGASLRQRIGVQLQEVSFPGKLTVEECLRLFASFYRPERRRPVPEAVALVHLQEKQGARIEKLSGGQKQRLSLACALVGRPDLLFLDEPTTGLDPQARRAIWEIVGGFVAEGGTVVLTTHYMEEAARLCHRLAVLDHGRVIAAGTPRELVDSLGGRQVIEARFSDPVPTDALRALPSVETVRTHELGAVLTVDEIGATLPALLALLEASGAGLLELSTHQATLEDVFVHLTGRGLRDG